MALALIACKKQEQKKEVETPTPTIKTVSIQSYASAFSTTAIVNGTKTYYISGFKDTTMIEKTDKNSLYFVLKSSNNQFEKMTSYTVSVDGTLIKTGITQNTQTVTVNF